MWAVRVGVQGWLFSRMESGGEGAGLQVESQWLSIDGGKCEVPPSLQLGLQAEGVQRGRFQHWPAAPHAGGDRRQREGPGQRSACSTSGGVWWGAVEGR